MERIAFFRAWPFGRSSREWQKVAAITGFVGGGAYVALALGSSSWLYALGALAWFGYTVVFLVPFRLPDRPVVVLQGDELVVARGWRVRRYALDRLTWDPDPFDVAAIRLRRADGKHVRIAKNELEGSARLEALLRERLAPAAMAESA